MIAALDTSVLVAAVLDYNEHHAACAAVVRSGRHSIHLHALSEIFATLTGGRLGFRVSPDKTVELIEGLLPSVQVATLTEREHLAALRETAARGVRGGAIYDYLHLVAARKVKATRFYTLNLGNFTAFHRPGDPEILRP